MHAALINNRGRSKQRHRLGQDGWRKTMVRAWTASFTATGPSSEHGGRSDRSLRAANFSANCCQDLCIRHGVKQKILQANKSLE